MPTHPAAPRRTPAAGPLDCARKIIRAEGVAGLYRGLKPNIIGVTPEKSLKLSVNDVLREYFTRANGGGGIALYQEVMAGGIAGFVQVRSARGLRGGALGGCAVGRCGLRAQHSASCIAPRTQPTTTNT